MSNMRNQNSNDVQKPTKSKKTNIETSLINIEYLHENFSNIKKNLLDDSAKNDMFSPDRKDCADFILIMLSSALRPGTGQISGKYNNNEGLLSLNLDKIQKIENENKINIKYQVKGAYYDRNITVDSSVYTNFDEKHHDAFHQTTDYKTKVSKCKNYFRELTKKEPKLQVRHIRNFCATMYLQNEINLIQAKCLTNKTYKETLSSELEKTFNQFLKSKRMNHSFFNKLFETTIKLLNHKDKCYTSLLHYIDPRILNNYLKFLIDQEKAKQIVYYLYRYFKMVSYSYSIYLV